MLVAELSINSSMLILSGSVLAGSRMSPRWFMQKQLIIGVWGKGTNQGNETLRN